MAQAPMLLTIRHRTEYRYRRPVQLQPHRVMVCPRGTYDTKLVETSLRCSPEARLDWSQDVFGNLIATASFAVRTDSLAIDSRMVVEHCAAAWPVFPIAPSAHGFPFRYDPDETVDLAALLLPATSPDKGRIASWAAGFVPGGTADTLALLQSINMSVHRGVAYRQREEEGTQSPAQTLDLATGSCRDIAALFIEGVRSLGLAARAVSGYLYSGEGAASDGQHGATHAWAEVYLPGAGWVAFDPTNGRMGSANLIAVAVARTIDQIPPVTGSYVGAREDFLDMRIDVRVTAEG